MIYLSKGAACKDPVTKRPAVCYAGKVFPLSTAEKSIWDNGRFNFVEVKELDDITAVTLLEKLGIVEVEQENTAKTRYRLLTRCFFCPAKKDANHHRMSVDENKLYTWLRYAGLRLTVAELVYLTDHRVEPTEDLLHKKNRQALVERIYTVDTIADRILESQMELARSRDLVTENLMGLLRKRYAILL